MTYKNLVLGLNIVCRYIIVTYMNFGIMYFINMYVINKENLSFVANTYKCEVSNTLYMTYSNFAFEGEIL
jgi:hypothetical protein